MAILTKDRSFTRLEVNARERKVAPRGCGIMKTVAMDVFAKLRKELRELERQNEELRSRNAELERRLTDLHGEYTMLRYRLKELPSATEFLKLRQELVALKKELRNRGWKNLI